MLYALLFQCGIWGQKSKYHSFENINIGSGISTVACFVQDPQGLMWIGTNKGLYSYDGYSAKPHFSFSDRSNTHIHCAAIIEQYFLYLGTDRGLLKYNIETDRYEALPTDLPSDIRCMLLRDSTLWLGSLDGLFSFHIGTHQLKEYSPEHYPNIPHKTVYSLLHGSDDRIFTGTYNGLCCYDAKSHKFSKISLPDNPKKNNQFINSLLRDDKRQCIYIGMEGGLLKYSFTHQTVEQIAGFEDNSVKSLALDVNGQLLVGTDNGLYIHTSGEATRHIVHHSRISNSLCNNVIWSIYSDACKNIWLGTDNGISFWRNNTSVQQVSIGEISGLDAGNQFFSIFKDTKNYYWLGGSNGLIRVKQKNGNWQHPVWYNTSAPQHYLPHGRIRHIYQDADDNLWLATDGSICQYQHQTEQFIPYNIVDSTYAYNSNWAYNILDDKTGKLWIASCLGGIFEVEKQKLITNKGKTYVADYHYNTENGLSGMFVNQIIADTQGNIWTLLYNAGINKINPHTQKVTTLPLGKYIDKENPSFILCDSLGRIWIGWNKGVLRLCQNTDKVEVVLFNASRTNELLSMREAEENIWVSTSEGLRLINKETLEMSYLHLSDEQFISLFYEKSRKRMLMGKVNGITIIDTPLHLNEEDNKAIVITALYVNGETLKLDKSIRYSEELNLDYRQNTITVEVSDFPYLTEEKTKIVYRLEGVDQDWKQLPKNHNAIAYSSLDYGNYKLKVSRLQTNGKPAKPAHTLNINIKAPWYLSPWAKFLYFVLLLGLITWTINFYQVRNRLKIERLEKAKISEQARMKMNFLSNISHEFKTPLSMIIAPVSRLLPNLKDENKRNKLKQIQQNAMKLNVLIHQMLDVNRIDNESNSLLIKSHTNLSHLAHRQLMLFEDAGNGNQHHFVFETNTEQLYLDLDVVKWESILTNLLSNAVKYTPSNGTITLSLNYNSDNNTIYTEVSDTGMGIPEKDLPYVFQRFFQSSKTKGQREGTGIGLYLVKKYVELHGGTVAVKSVENEGTTVGISLSGKALNADFSPSEQASPMQPGNAEESDTPKPTILVVDDNIEISTLLCEILQDDYNCLQAANGKEGLSVCLKENPELIISDAMMPIMDGMEMCKKIRKNATTSSIPIIMLTAKNDQQTELKSMQLHIDAFMPKPFAPDMLLMRVEQLTQKSREMESKIRLAAIAAPKAISAESHDEKFLHRITHIIEEHLADPDLNVNAICRISGISNKQIYRKIKQLTGTSPVDYLKQVRIKKAAMLLRQKKFSVAEVMYMVGYSNHSYFSKCFKAEFNKTPLEYKEEGV